MNDLFSWWHWGNVQIAIVLFLVLCALGTLVSLALVGSDKRSKREQAHDDAEQAKAVRKVSSANYWGKA